MLAAAVLPALVLLAAFLRYDRFPEPRRVVLGTFFRGMLVIPLLAGVSYLLAPVFASITHPAGLAFVEAFFLAGLLEESAKFLVLYGYSMRHAAFDEPMDGLVYGMTASLGFACLENITYLGSAGPQWLGLAIARGLLAVPSHGFNGAIMGYYAGRARFNGAIRAETYWKALLIPSLLHGVYDFSPILLSLTSREMSEEELALAAGVIGAVTLAIVAAQAMWTLRLFRRQRAEQFLPPPLMIPSTPQGPDRSGLV